MLITAVYEGERCVAEVEDHHNCGVRDDWKIHPSLARPLKPVIMIPAIRVGPDGTEMSH
jgi:hypothetical protein